MRIMLLCFLFCSCANLGGKFPAKKEPLKNDFFAIMLVNGWSARHYVKLGELIEYRSEPDAVYFSFKNPKGKLLYFKVHRDTQKVELLKKWYLVPKGSQSSL